jgi:hypothetical protein
VTHLGAVLHHHFLELVVADRVRHIPVDRPSDHVPFEVTALERDRRMLAAETVAWKRTPGASLGQICERTRCSAYTTNPAERPPSSASVVRRQDNSSNCAFKYALSGRHG